MKNYKILLLVFLIIPFITFSQEGKDSVVVKDKPERPAFESSFIIDNPTNVLFDKNTLEVIANDGKKSNQVITTFWTAFTVILITKNPL